MLELHPPSVPPAMWTVRDHAGAPYPEDPSRGQRLPEGTLLAGKYVVGEVLGRGSTSTVYSGEQRPMGRPVAIKLASASAPGSEGHLRLVREARILAEFAHEALVRVFEVGWLETGPAAIVMERLVGETLRQRLKREGVMGAPELVPILQRVLDGLAVVHEAKVVHRDLAPGNIFLARSRQGMVPKLIDFGLGRDLEEASRLTAVGRVVGQPAYMAPEQLLHGMEVDARADLYTLGVTAYEALTGRPPFVAPANAVIFKVIRERAPLASVTCPSLGTRWDGFLAKALAKSSEDRFQTAREMSRALDTLA